MSAAPIAQTTEIFEPNSQVVFTALAKQSFAMLATTSQADRPHAAGVVFAQANGCLYINTLRTSRKARNVAANPCVAMCIPTRRIPVGPPSTVHFQGTAELLSVDDPEIVQLLESGELKSITGHGELELPGSCFVRISFGRRLLTHGLGMSIRSFATDPLRAGGVVQLD